MMRESPSLYAADVSESGEDGDACREASLSAITPGVGGLRKRAGARNKSRVPRTESATGIKRVASHHGLMPASRILGKTTKLRSYKTSKKSESQKYRGSRVELFAYSIEATTLNDAARKK